MNSARCFAVSLFWLVGIFVVLRIGVEQRVLFLGDQGSTAMQVVPAAAAMCRFKGDLSKISDAVSALAPSTACECSGDLAEKIHYVLGAIAELRSTIVASSSEAPCQADDRVAPAPSQPPSRAPEPPLSTPTAGPEGVETLPATELVAPASRGDALGAFLWEVEALVRSAPRGSLLDAAPGDGRLLREFGPRFGRVAALAASPAELEALRRVAPPGADLAVATDLQSFAAQAERRFDVVFLSMAVHRLSTGQVAPTLAAVRDLLEPGGRAVISTTNVEDSAGCQFQLADGQLVEREEFDNASSASRFQRWAPQVLLHTIRAAALDVEDHFFFAWPAGTREGAFKVWERDRVFNRRYVDALHQPMFQAVFVRPRIARPPAVGFISWAGFVAPVEPSSPDVKDVVFKLVRGGRFREDYDKLLTSRKCLLHALGGSAVFDEVVFHEGNVPLVVQEELQAELPRLRFVDARGYGGFGGVGASAEAWRPWERIRVPGEYSVGYRHMCRFMFAQWFVALARYEFAMRVDDDVCIERLSDPFRAMRSVGALYGYGLETEEKHAETVGTLQPWLEYYAKSRSLRPRSGPLDAQRMYFTNYFISNVSWWFRDDVQAYIQAVWRTGNIYDHRWGDAPLQSAALHLFGGESDLLFIPMDYSHLSTRNKIANGTEADLPDDLANHIAQPSASKLNAAFEWQFENALSPCLLANHLKLPGAPFEATQAAVGALKLEVKSRTNLSRSEIDRYGPMELAQLVQFDLLRADAPLPPDSVVGLERKQVYVRLIGGGERRNATEPDFTKDEFSTLLLEPCCRSGLANKIAEVFRRQSASLRSSLIGRPFGRRLSASAIPGATSRNRSAKRAAARFWP